MFKDIWEDKGLQMLIQYLSNNGMKESLELVELMAEYIQQTEIQLDKIASDIQVIFNQIVNYKVTNQNFFYEKAIDKCNELKEELSQVEQHEIQLGSDNAVLDAPTQLDTITDEIHLELMRLSEGEAKVFNINGLTYEVQAVFDEEIEGDKYYTYNITNPDGKVYNNMFFKDANKFLEEKAYQNNDAKEDLRKQIEELKEVLKGYEKINKNNTLDYRIKGIEQHIEALEDLSYGRDLVSEWKEALKDDLREVRNIDEWEHEL